MSQHLHGGRVFTAALDLNLPWTAIRDFSANINPQGQPPGLKEHLFLNFEATIHYPEVDARTLTKVIAQHAGLPETSILSGAGSTPQIRLLSRLIKPQRPVILGPAFAEYEESLNVNGFTPTYVLASLEDEFALTPELVNKTFALQPDLIFLANPANPTGRLVPPEVLTSLFERAQKAGIKVILDEAFIGFTFGKSSQGLTLTHPGLIVLRSLTKILAIPGLRLAYLAAHPDLIQRLREHAEPWPINFMALEAGIYSLPQKDYLEATPRVTEKLRNMLISRLSPFVTFIPSDTNFVLAKVRDKEKLIAHLYQKGILVRDCANFAGIGPDFLRLAVRPEPEQIDLLEAFEEFYA